MAPNILIIIMAVASEVEILNTEIDHCVLINSQTRSVLLVWSCSRKHATHVPA